MQPPPLPVQHRVLTARYRATVLADPGTLAILVGQAPLIGWLCAVVWGSVETDTPSLYFVLALAAVWFGCIDACREIVKERAIVERERLLGVRALPYVLSKVKVLAAVVLAQVVLLELAVEWSLAVRGPLLVQTAALFGAGMCGVGLGLVVSAVSRSQERAVGMVPLLLIPQILFSELALPGAAMGLWVERVSWLMPVRWAYKVFVDGAALEPAWGHAALSLGVLVAYAAALVGLAALAMTRRREVV